MKICPFCGYMSLALFVICAVWGVSGTANGYQNCLIFLASLVFLVAYGVLCLVEWLIHEPVVLTFRRRPADRTPAGRAESKKRLLQRGAIGSFVFLAVTILVYRVHSSSGSLDAQDRSILTKLALAGVCFAATGGYLSMLWWKAPGRAGIERQEREAARIAAEERERVAARERAEARARAEAEAGAKRIRDEEERLRREREQEMALARREENNARQLADIMEQARARGVKVRMKRVVGDAEVEIVYDPAEEARQEREWRRQETQEEMDREKLALEQQKAAAQAESEGVRRETERLVAERRLLQEEQAQQDREQREKDREEEEARRKRQQEIDRGSW